MSEHSRAFSVDTDQANPEELSGCTVSFGPQVQTLDVKAALDAGEGVIVADSPEVISVLRSVLVLKEVDVPDGAEPTPVNVTLDSPTSSTPVGVIPQGAPPAELEANAQVVHADEAGTVDEAVGQGTDAPPVLDAGIPGNTEDTTAGTADSEEEPNPTPPARRSFK